MKNKTLHGSDIIQESKSSCFLLRSLPFISSGHFYSHVYLTHILLTLMRQGYDRGSQDTKVKKINKKCVLNNDD